MPYRREFQDNGPQGVLRGVEWFAPAKVNIFLRILGRRADGYHDLESLMVPLSVGDTLTAMRQEGGEAIEFSVDDANLGAPDDNLVVRAAKAFFGVAPKRASVSLRLQKRTPVAAGLGGGSSDAAATLQALNHLFDKPLSPATLADLGKKLGADVPFFLLDKAALARGIGENLTPLDAYDPVSIVLVNPGFAVSTAWVYQNLDLTLTSGSASGRLEAMTRGVKWSSLLRNDLETVTLKAHPELVRIKETFLEHGANGSLMSGSGPTVFGIFEGKDRKIRAERSMVAFSKNANYRVLQAESL